jgi:hypothetical protein
VICRPHSRKKNQRVMNRQLSTSISGKHRPENYGEGADRVRGPTVVMAGLVPAIHVFDAQRKDRRGCPAQGRA